VPCWRRRKRCTNLCINVGIHAQRYRRRLAHFAGDLREALEFWDGFNVKTLYASLKCGTHFPGLFTNARKYHLRGICTGGQYTGQFTARNNIKAAPQSREFFEHRKV
jgi:hypothetical protein